MSQAVGQPDENRKIAVERNPTPDGEGGFFSSADEKKQTMSNNHQLAIHDRNLGSIGKYTGSTNPSLNIAAAIIAGLVAALFACILGSSLQGLKEFGPYTERLIAAILTVGGFIFGVRQGSSDK